MKKILCIVIVMCMLASALPVIAADNSSGNNIYWNYDSGYLYITGDGDMKRYYDLYGFRSIPWEQYEDEITTVIIGGDVNSVFLTYFLYCENLTDIYYQGYYDDWNEICGEYRIDDVNLHFLGPNSEWITIQNTKNLTNEVSFFNGQRWIFDSNKLIIRGYGYIREGIRISEMPYDFDNKINELVVENGITRIEENVFKNLVHLQRIEIADSVEIIGNNAFSDCRNMVEADLGSGVTTIGKYAFSGCTSLRNIKLGKNLKKICKYAFSGCNNIKNVSVENLAAWADVIFENNAANPARFSVMVTEESTVPDNIILDTNRPNEKGETAPGISDASYALDTEDMIPIVQVNASQAPEAYNCAQNAIDGSAYTRWAAYGPADIIFDLGREQYVEGANAYFWRWEVRSMPYELYVSKDGITYDKVYDGVSLQGYINNYTPIKKNVRYIKLVITNPEYNGWMSLNEFVVYGK